MLKHFLSILVFFLCFPSFGQAVTIKGKIIDETSHLPLESATVYISSAKDSTIIDYTISDRKGQFSISTKKIKRPFYLRVSFIGYKDYRQEIKELSGNMDIGVLYVQNNPNDLQEVVIKNEAPPVRIKKDTLEFNATSFKVRQDSNVETLLKQLPGVEIDKEGKITVNGKEVNKILVNGKPFFGKDGKIATQNLPSNIIDKIQVSDTKTKEEELSGQTASSDNKTINLTIQKDKSKGVFGKLNGGGGTKGRYESGGLINYFKDKQKISVLGSSNNINAVGFSMDDVFDSMGGGRVRYVGGNGSGGSGGQPNPNMGITQSNILGFNYTDQIGKTEPSGSYFYTSTENNNANRSKFQNLQNNTVSTSENISRTVTNGHNLNLEIEAKIDPMTTLMIIPNYKRSNSRSTATNSANTVSADTDALENDTNGYSDSNTNNKALDNTMSFFRKFTKRGRSLSLVFTNNNSSEESKKQTISRTNLYTDAEVIDRNQLENNDNRTDNYSGNIGYREPITDSLTISFGTKFKLNKQVQNKHTFGFDTGSSSYTDEIAAQTNYINSKNNTFSPFGSIDIRKKRFDLGLNIGAQFSKFKNFSRYLGDETILDKNYIFPSITTVFSYRISITKAIRMDYNYDINMPLANQVLPVENLADPLNTIVGNPDLDPVRSHRFSISYNNFNMSTRTLTYFYMGGSFYDNQIVTVASYLSSAAQRSTFANVDNTYNTYLGMSYSGSIEKEQHTFKYKLGINNVLGLNKGFYSTLPDPSTPIDESIPILYESKSYSFIPKIELIWEYGKLLTVSPSYTFNYNAVNFKNFVSNNTSYYVHNLKLETTSYWPKHFVLGNDFGYNYNSNIADGFKKDFYLWNVSLGYNFFQDKLLAKIKVYDLLDQNINTTRTVTPVAIQDVENTVLKRYAMFSLTYTIEQFGAKKKQQ